MRAKLTITIEKDLIPQAKRYAKSRGTSLSRLIEGALREANASEKTLSFSERWRGRFRPAERDSARYKRLARKYL